MGVGPAGKKSNTPKDNGLRNNVSRTGGIMAVKSPAMTTKDCCLCQQTFCVPYEREWFTHGIFP